MVYMYQAIVGLHVFNHRNDCDRNEVKIAFIIARKEIM